MRPIILEQNKNLSSRRDRYTCDTNPKGYIWELCVALEHRWNPDALFLIFTAYFDESDTHGPAPDLILAAFLGHARQWRVFERRLRAMQRKYGFQIFHAKDFRAGRGEFSAWDERKSMALLDELAVAIRDNLEEAVTITLPRAMYEADYRNSPTPKGMNLDSQYGLCFRACLHNLISIITKDKKMHRLHVVIEDGHKNVGDTVRIFNEVKEGYAELGFNLLGTITVEKKKDCPLLMVADFQAHLSSINEDLKRAGQPSYIDLSSEPSPNAKGAGLSFINFTSEHLRRIKELWAEDKQRRIDEWRAVRDAKRAAVSSEGQPS